ncbi:hypothetical protein NKJ06_19540 [Mesorhizobium sp. M0293]|uniref:hypothetical protein n=1 Tax=unclassified Mesorhizobium TaxID=325217 RepID=UPI00333D07CA
MGIAAGYSILGYAPAAEKERDMSRFEASLDVARKCARLIVMTSAGMPSTERPDANAHATPRKDPGHDFQA